jgi:hypothetical protein
MNRRVKFGVSPLDVVQERRPFGKPARHDGVTPDGLRRSGMQPAKPSPSLRLNLLARAGG